MVDFRAKVETARKAGYSDDEIKKFLFSQPEAARAREAGYSDAEIASHLGLGEPSLLDKAASEADYIIGKIPENLMQIGQSLTPTELSRTINRAVMSPVETAAGVLQGIGNFVQDPYGTFREAPVSTVMNVAPVVGVAGKLTGAARRFAAPVFEPQQAAVQNIMSKLAKPQEFVNAMAQPIAPVPGAPPVTASQAAVQAGLSEPAVAGLETALKDVTQPYGREVFALEEQRLSAIQQQIRNIDESLKRRADTMSPAETAKLKTVRDDLLRSAAAEEQRLTAAGQALQTQLPLTSMRAQGETIQEAARGIRTNLRENVIEPAYREPITRAGNARIDITPVVNMAEQVLGRPLTAYQPETAPGPLARELASLRQPPTPGKWVSLGEGAGYHGEPGPPRPTTATLRQIDAIRRGINADLAQAAQATDAGAPTRYSALREMSSRLNRAIETTEAIPNEIKAGYARANELYGQVYAPRIKHGITGDMLHNTARGLTKLLPDDIVDAVLKNETNAQQFVRTFGEDPTARGALNASIINRVRDAAFDPATGFIRPEAIDRFAQNPALTSLGIDLQATLAPLREEAVRINEGLTELEARARRLNKSDATKIVDTALKNAPEMDFVMRQIGPNAREALRKEVTDRALGMIRADDPAKAIKYLEKHVKPLEMAIGKEAVKDIRGLVDAQTVLKQVEDTAPRPKKQVALALDGYTAAQLTDMKSLVDEINRVEEVARLASVRPTASAVDLAAQEGVAGEQIPAVMSRAVTVTKSVLDKISSFATKQMQVETARLLVKDRELLGQLLNEALAKKERPPSTAWRKAVAPTAFVSSQNRNAMARQ